MVILHLPGKPALILVPGVVFMGFKPNPAAEPKESSPAPEPDPESGE